MNPVAVVVLVNTGLVLIGIAIMANYVDTKPGESGLFLLALLPVLMGLLTANLAMVFVAIFIKAERERVPGYLLSIFLLGIGILILFWLGIMTMGKIGG